MKIIVENHQKLSKNFTKMDENCKKLIINEEKNCRKLDENVPQL